MIMEQFSRTELLLGEKALKKLQRASVTVLGLGAVGAQCAEALARAGVGKFCLVDFDVIKPSNINRHIWAFHSTVNTPKAILGRERIADINPEARAEAEILFVDQETIKGLLARGTDLVIDAIDSLNPKVQALEACWRAGVPVISSMGAATRTDPFAVRHTDLMDTTHCPLAKRVRQLLKDRGVGRGIRAVYSFEPSNISALSPDCQKDPDDHPRGRPRRKMGSLSTLTGIFGLTLAHAALAHFLPEMGHAACPPSQRR